jgi:hypothetical protein
MVSITEQEQLPTSDNRIEHGTPEDKDGELITQNNAHYALSSLKKQNFSVESGTSITVLMYSIKFWLIFDTSTWCNSSGLSRKNEVA